MAGLVRQAELGGDQVVAALQVVRPPARIAGGAGLAVGLENVVIAAGIGRLAGDLAHMGENAGFEIDQGTDHVECQGFELLERHRGRSAGKSVGVR
jgi:hypothetical protein